MKYFSFFSLLFVTFFSFSQGGNPDATPTYYIDYNTLELPPSPQAQNFNTYGNTPVDLSTGVPSISIPIFTIEEDGVSVPISLSYHASGVKVNELETSVGLKWTLSAGGNINRTVKSKADETLGWLDPNNTSISDSFLAQNHNLSSWRMEAKRQSEQNDHNPDDFNYFMPGYSGGFKFKKDTTLIYTRKDKIDILPSFDGGGQGSITGFVANDFNGNTYNFGTDKEVSRNTLIYGSLGSSVSRPNYDWSPHTTGWMLSDIQTKNGKSIDFEYENYRAEYIIPQTQHSMILSDPCYFSGPGDGVEALISTTTTDYDYDVKLISKVSTENVEVLFTYATDTNYTHWQKKLTTITINDLISGETKSFEFNYGTFTSSDNTPDKRLKLTQIIERINGTQSKPAYQFEYNSTPLPNRGSYSQDFFGYYNGISGSGSLIHDYDDEIDALFTSNGFGGGFPLSNLGDRSLGANFIEACMLKKITYPTGGTTEFFYEPNQEITTQDTIYSGGVRIQKIQDKDDDGTIYNKKTYQYEGLQGLDLELYYQFTKNQSGESISYHSSFVADPDLVPSGHYYKKVTQITHDGTTQLKEVSEFINGMVDNVQKGLINEMKTYRGSDLIKATEYVYEIIGTPQTIQWNKFDEQQCVTHQYGTTPYLGYDQALPFSFVGDTEKIPIKISTTEFLRQNGVLKPITTVQEYEYSDDNLLNVSEVKDTKLIRRLLTNGDLDYDVSNPLDKDPLFDTNYASGERIDIDYTYAVDENITTLPKASLLKKVVTSDHFGSIIYGQAFEYDISGNIKRIFQFNKGLGTNNSSLSYVPSNYEEAASFVFEGENMVEIRNKDDVPISYIWGYGDQIPVAKIENLAYSSIPSSEKTALITATNNGGNVVTALLNLQNALPTTAMMTGISYTPMVGVNVMIDPRGYKMIYEYDNLNRLLYVKDEQNNILSENEYNYKY